MRQERQSQCAPIAQSSRIESTAQGRRILPTKLVETSIWMLAIESDDDQNVNITFAADE